MRRALALLLLIAPLAAQGPSLREQIDGIHSALSSGERDLEDLIERTKPLLKLGHGREAVADALEDPRNRLGWNASLKGRMPTWWATGGVEVGRESGGFLIEKGPVEFHGTFDPKDRSLTMAFEIGRSVTADGLEAKIIVTQTFTYPSKEAYDRARGLEPSRWKGMRGTLAIMERTVPWFQKDAPVSVEPRSIQSIDDVGREVMRELRKVVPDMFDAATQYESVTYGYGVRVGHAKGIDVLGSGMGTKVEIEHMRHTRFKRGETKGVDFASTGVGFGLGAKLSGPLGLGKAEGKLSATITRSDDPAQEPDPDQKVLAKMIRSRQIEGLAAETYRRASAKLSPRSLNLGVGTGLLSKKRLGRLLETGAATTDLAREEARRLEERARDAMNTLQQDTNVVYRRGKEGAVEVYMRLEDGTHRALRVAGDQMEVFDLEARKRYRLGRAEAARLLDKVGGVKLDVAADIVRTLDAGRVDRQVVLVEGRVVLVSLRNLARRFTGAGGWRGAGRDLTEPGALSRIHGYVRVDDDVVLLGTRQAGHAAVRLEDLVVALRWVWGKKQTPACSLDPVPGDPRGPQMSRILGVPEDSHFAKVMLDADYRMKRIVFGELPSGAPGFRSLRDVAGRRRGLFKSSRYWFFPLRPAREQLQASPSRDAALFIANLEVRTEVMKLAASGFGGAGDRDEATETVVRSFTENFGAIAKRHRIFAELRRLLDLTVVARLLRHAGIDVPCLRELAAVDHPPTKVPKSYANVYVEFGIDRYGGFGVQGGAALRQRLGRRLMASREDLQFLRLRSAAAELSRSGEVARATGERSLVISPLTFRLGEIEGLLRNGQALLASGDAEKARQVFTSVLAKEPGLPEALALRGLSALQLGDLPAAEKDIEAAVHEDPADDYFRNLAQTIAFLGGKRPLRDPLLKRRVAEAATRRAELNEARGRRDLAEKDLAVAISADPGHAPAYVARAMLRQTGNRFREAVEDWDTVVRLQPRWFAAYSNRAIAKLNVGDNWGAIDDCDLAIGLDAGHFLAYWTRGTAKTQLGDDAGAIEDLDEAIRRNPGFATSFRNRAQAKFKSGDPKGWAADMVTNLALRGEAGEGIEFSRSRGFYLDTCSRVVRREPSFGPAHAVRGLLYLHDGAWADAVRDLDQALAHPPRHPGLRVPGRDLAASMKQYAAALRQLERDRAYLLFRRASAHLKLSNREAALADLDAAVRLDPGLRRRAEALR